MAFQELFFFALGLVFFNALALGFANHFRTLIFLDTIATAIAAFSGHHYLPALGAWADPVLGAVVGLATNLLVGLGKYRPYLYFAHVNVVCGIAWGLISAFVFFPTANSGVTVIIRYIVIVGVVVGIIAGVCSAQMRQKLGFKSSHLLDNLSGAISLKWKTANRFVRFYRICSAELLVSHILDKLLATTIGVMYVLGAYYPGSEINATYRDLMELVAGYYYLAIGYVIIRLRKMEVDFKPDEMILLGPLGLFAGLIAFPVFLRLIGFVR